MTYKQLKSYKNELQATLTQNTLSPSSKEKLSRIFANRKPLDLNTPNKEHFWRSQLESLLPPKERLN